MSILYDDNYQQATTIPDGALSQTFKGAYGPSSSYSYGVDASRVRFPNVPIGYRGCYQMFSEWNHLRKAPYKLSMMSLGNNCYEEMFKDCTGLTDAPVLPATTLSPSCYSRMFNGCTNLVNAPALPATTLVEPIAQQPGCYQGMF